ncbi:MAG: diguanylate cyclase, partial [Pseudomonadota bacterium]
MTSGAYGQWAMDAMELLSRLGLRGSRRKRGDQLSARVRRVLVETLYTQPLSLSFGVTMGLIASGVTAWMSGLQAVWIGFGLMTIIGTARVALAMLLGRSVENTSTNALELVYEIGAFAYALLMGAMAAMTLWFEAARIADVVMVTGTLCYAIGSSARNAGRPVIAIGQLVFASLPIVIAGFAVGSSVGATLAVTTLMLVPAMISITLNLYKVLRDSIATAEESAQLADTMQNLARSDVVTGLANRAGLNHAMVETMMTRDEDSQFALIWIDLDRFKEVNDLLGHPVGDRVLVEVGRRLQDVCPEGSTVSRFGGDEFVVFCPVTSRKDAERISSEVHAEIMSPIRVEADRLEVRASLGVALLPQDGEDADTLMQRADLALYHAKVGGRAQTCFFNASMTRDLIRRREIEDELRIALQRDELSIFFQPIVDLGTGKIRTFEALVRW